MIRLNLCNRCGYVGDLSDLPDDPDWRDMTKKQIEARMKKEIPKTIEMFRAIGWLHFRNGEDLCPDCAEDNPTYP